MKRSSDLLKVTQLISSRAKIQLGWGGLHSHSDPLLPTATFIVCISPTWHWTPGDKKHSHCLQGVRLDGKVGRGSINPYGSGHQERNMRSGP